MLYDNDNRGIIQNRKRARQIIDFSGVRYGNITPTDIDGYIEYHDKAIILVEMKLNNAEVPYGQYLALKRLIDNSAQAGKDAVLFICEHNIDDCEKDIDASNAIVRTIYYSKQEYSGNSETLRYWIDRFIKKVERTPF